VLYNTYANIEELAKLKGRVYVNRGVRHRADGFRQLYPVLFTQGALADALHVGR